MRAAVIREPGTPEVFEIQEIEDPIPAPDEVLISVAATALNRADLLQRLGRYPGPVGTRDDIPGLEMAGTVESVGERVTLWQPGDRVMALLSGGGYASKLVVHERMLMKVPSNLSLYEAAAIPEVFLTAYDALFEQCQLTMGEKVLIHAIGSGVGTAASQLAKTQGCFVFGTASTSEKIERAKKLGLDVGINYNEDNFAEIINEITHNSGVDVVLDVIGAHYWRDNLTALAECGRMVIVGTLGGSKLEVNLGMLMAKRAQVRGTLLRGRSIEEKISLTQKFSSRVLPLFENGSLIPIIDSEYSILEIAKAHHYMESNANFGKIIVRHID